MPTAKRRIRPRQQAVAALDLGGTKLASGIFAESGRPIARRAVALKGRGGKEAGQLIVHEVHRLIKAAARHGLAIRAIGASVPGIVNGRSGCVWAPNIPGWGDYPLRDELAAAIDDSSVNVVVESDRAASILGESWQGAARGCRNAIFVAVGTGIGAGILVDGRVLQGAHGIAGAIGWLALDRPFRKEYVNRGCFESHASGDGIAKVAAATLKRQKRYRGPLGAKGSFTAHDVFGAFEKGDAVAKKTLAEAVEFWGMASANLISLFNPEKIIFGGGVFGPASRFIDEIAAEAKKWAQPIALRCAKFEVSQLGGEAALYGAAYLASH